MSPRTDLDNLPTLNRIVETLNRAVDVRGVLDTALAQLVKLMGLETGWIFLKDPAASERQWGEGYLLAAYHNLPPALALDNLDAWLGGCECQGLCDAGGLTEACNQVHCSRLAHAAGDRRGLAVHASAPLRSGERALGILNVAGPDWASFSPRTLALLNNVGNQMGIALERAQLFDLLRERRIHEQIALLDLSNQLLRRLDMDDLMGYMVQETQRLLQADACALLLPAEEAGFLEFRAASGWRNDPVAERRRVPADESSGPGLAMRTQQPVLAGDIQKSDPSPWLPEWLWAEEFRGHNVIPLIADGRSVGVLVLDTRQPHLLDEDQTRFLRLIANQAAMAIERAWLHQQEIRRQRLEEELAVGQKIQQSLLPQTCPVVTGWEFAAFYQPARQVSGDFYDFFRLPGDGDQLGMVIADVSDKGVPAALFMALSRTVIRTTAFSGRRPAAALVRANELILNDSWAEMFLSAFYATLDTQTGHLVYANAGHNRPLWRRAASGECEELAAKGIILGILDEVELQERHVQIDPGDVLVFYTDGVTEATNAEGQMFGEAMLREVLLAHATDGAQQVLDAVVRAVNAFTDETPQSDDLTLFVVKRCPAEQAATCRKEATAC